VRFLRPAAETLTEVSETSPICEHVLTHLDDMDGHAGDQEGRRTRALASACAKLADLW